MYRFQETSGVLKQLFIGLRFQKYRRYFGGIITSFSEAIYIYIRYLFEEKFKLQIYKRHVIIIIHIYVAEFISGVYTYDDYRLKPQQPTHVVFGCIHTTQQQQKQQ